MGACLLVYCRVVGRVARLRAPQRADPFGLHQPRQFRVGASSTFSLIPQNARQFNLPFLRFYVAQQKGVFWRPDVVITVTIPQRYETTTQQLVHRYVSERGLRQG